MKFLINLIVTAVAAYAIAHFLPSVTINGFGAAILFALVFGILNALVRPILVIFTIPVTVITLGLFLLVINALIILLADYFVSGIEVDGFWWALVFSILLSIVTSIINSIFKNESN